MNLVIDFGNTNIKCGVFDTDRLIQLEKFQLLSEVRDFINQSMFYQFAVYSVSHDYEEIKNDIPELSEALFFNYQTKNPLKINL